MLPPYQVHFIVTFAFALEHGSSRRISLSYPGISAKVHAELRVDVRSATFISRLSTEPTPAL
jgi:hypothetical protein